MNQRKKLNELTEDPFKEKIFIPGKTFIPTGLAIYDHNELNSVMDALLSERLGLSRKGTEFENQFSEIMGCKKTLLVNSGSSANLLALEGVKERYNLKEGSNIITPACGFPTTINPIIQLGFKPNFVDVDETYNISVEGIEKAIDSNTVAIMFAHTLGNPAKINEIIDLANKHNLLLVEDCCDAYGSKYDGKKCGSFGEVSTASFYPAHHITLGGEGGAISTNDERTYKIMRSFRDWGKACHCEPGQDNMCGKRFNFELNGAPYDHKYIFNRIGYNLKPTEMQAAMGIEQLKRIKDFDQKRKENFKIYNEVFAEFKDNFEFVEIDDLADPVFFGFPLMINNERIDRRDFVSYLNKNKIGTRYLFGGNLMHHPAYKNIECIVSEDLKMSNRIERDLFWMGIHPGIGREEIEYIGSTMKDYLAGLD